MLKQALLVDARGRPIAQHHKVFSQAWDEIRLWSNEVYMRYDVAPIGRQLRPASTMHSAQVGRIVVTRFKYGIPVRVQDWDQDAGKIFVGTTIGGVARHGAARGDTVETRVGGSFVADCSRVDYRVEFDPDHLQFNLTIPHDLLERTAMDWFGFVPGDALWQSKVGLGGPESSWLGLMDYVARSIAEAPEAVAEGRVAAHLEQTICVRLLLEWAARSGLDLTDPGHRIAPRTVRAAERYMADHAADLPTMAEVAQAVGTSVRTLSGAFRAFRGYTPGAYLRGQRLDGVRRALQQAGPGDTVGWIASQWGYVNMGEFARSYRQQFGELPSATLRRG